MSEFCLVVIDSNGKKHELTYSLNCYSNLMELLVNELFEDVGDCKGRAWCGTCLVELISSSSNSKIESEEQHKLDEFHFANGSDYRLSCQLFLNEELNGTVWRVSEGRDLL